MSVIYKDGSYYREIEEKDLTREELLELVKKGNVVKSDLLNVSWSPYNTATTFLNDKECFITSNI